MADPSEWTVHGTHRVFASDWVNIDLDDVEVPGGPRFEHHVIRFPRVSVGAVVIDDDRVLLLWRHRFTTDTWGWEIPAGWADPREEPEDAVRREILEETGHRVSVVKPLVRYHPLTGISDQRYRVFLASDARHEGPPDAAEASRVEWVPITELRGLIADGQITDGPSLTALATFLALR
ncbi:NUDIX hydrolase [Actinokineospora sp. 24-640]